MKTPKEEFTACIAVGGDHPCFAGHFPEHPIVPGVLLLDLIVVEIQAYLRQPLRLATILSTKFQRPVAPDERIEVRVRIFDDEQPQTLLARFQVISGDIPIMEGSLLLAVSAIDKVSG